MPPSPLAVVVPTRDRPSQLAVCLDSLRADLSPGDQLLVVDSASRRGEDVRAVVEAAGATYVRCDVKGASRARNAGWRAVSHEQVVFVDDDMEVQPGWADAFRGVVEQEGVAFAGGRTLAPEGVGGEAASVTVGRPREVLDRTVRGPLAASNNLAVRRSVLALVGGFDERLGPGTWLEAGEDVELLDRVLEAGFTGRYVHEAVAVHEQWRSPAERRRLQFAYGKGMGARVAAAVRRDPREGVHLLADVFRLRGILTLLRRARPAPVPLSQDGEVLDSGGWLLPIIWRVGAVVGLLAGLVLLPPRQPVARV